MAAKIIGISSAVLFVLCFIINQLTTGTLKTISALFVLACGFIVPVVLLHEFLSLAFDEPKKECCEKGFCQNHVPFSVSAYLSRRERECLNLLEEREREGPYIITLWLGFDGLRLNADGTTEWVSRREQQSKKNSQWFNVYNDDIDGNIHKPKELLMMRECTQTESKTLEALIRSNIQNQTQELQLKNLQMQPAMLSTNPAVPVYTAYSCVSPYLGGYNPCYNPYYNPCGGPYLSTYAFGYSSSGGGGGTGSSGWRGGSRGKNWNT